MSRQTRDRQIMRFVTETPWAILPSALRQIQQVVAFHANGGRLTREEIAETLEATARPRSNGGTPAASIAVLPLWGTIVPHGGLMSEMSGATALDSWLAQFQALAADPAVGTIVLNIDSPGGSVDLVSETAAAIRAARKNVRVVAVANTMAASAAYDIAAQADEIYVTPSGLVGSIGVYTAHEDLSGALEQEGVNVTLISAPTDGFKTESSPFAPLSEEALAAKQKMVNDFYALFVDDVAKGRGVDASTVEAAYGKGRVMTARDALAAGMVDGVASLDQVLGKLAKGQSVGRTAALASQSFVSGLGVAADLNGFAVERIYAGDWPSSGSANHDIKSASAETSTTARTSSATTRRETTMDPVITDGRPLTREDLLAEQANIKELQDDLNAAAPGRAYTEEEQAEDDRLEARYQEIKAAIASIDQRDARARQKLKEKAAAQGVEIKGDGGNGTPEWGGNTNTNRRGPEDIFDLTAYRRHAGSVDQLGALWADGAKRANEITRFATDHKDETRAFVERLIKISEGKNTTFENYGHRFLVTADPAFEESFGRWVMGRETNRDSDRIKAAVNNTGLGSETPVPVTIDPTVLYTGAGARLPIRELARVVTITGLKWRGIASDGITMTYAAESTAFSPGTPTFDAPDITVEKAKGEVQFSVEVDTDWPSLREELQREFAQAKYNLEANKFLLGTGTNEPQGLIHALVTDGTSIVKTATHDVITIDDVTGVSDDLPSTFDSNATWLAHKKFYTYIRSLAREEGAMDPWQPLTAGFQEQSGLLPYLFHGSRAATASEMSALFTQADEDVALIGDFENGFVIVDRVGMNVELDMHPRDGNGAWLGQRALLAWFRNNTALRTPNAFRLLQVKGS